MYPYHFLFRQAWLKNCFSIPNPIFSYCPLVLLSKEELRKANLRSKLIFVKVRQKARESCVETGTVEPQTQPRRKSDGHCRRLMRWIWGTRTINPVLQMQNMQLFGLQEHLKRHCNFLPHFTFNRKKTVINLIKSYLLLILVNERDTAPTVIKKAIQFVSFRFGKKQSFDILNFIKAYKKTEIKRVFSHECLDCTLKFYNKRLLPYDAFLVFWATVTTLTKTTTTLKISLKFFIYKTNRARLKMDNILPTGAESFVLLQNVWENERMQCFADFRKFNSNKSVVPTMEAVQNMIEFNHNKGIDMVKLGCSLTNFTNNCLHK